MVTAGHYCLVLDWRLLGVVVMFMFLLVQVTADQVDP